MKNNIDFYKQFNCKYIMFTNIIRLDDSFRYIEHESGYYATWGNDSYAYLDENGLCHNNDGIALSKNGEDYYLKHGVIHREDGPAIIWSNGSESWYKDGLLHREDGPAKKDKNSEYWYHNGSIHRDGGPAVTHHKTNTKIYYRHGKIHREDGPAILSDGDKNIQYFLNGLPITQKLKKWCHANKTKFKDIGENELLIFAFEYKLKGGK